MTARMLTGNDGDGPYVIIHRVAQHSAEQAECPVGEMSPVVTLRLPAELLAELVEVEGESAPTPYGSAGSGADLD